MSNLIKVDLSELASIIVSALELDESPEDIIVDAPLFGYNHPDSLGLDSIDALEIALAIAQKYGVQIKADDEKNVEIFSSLTTLASYVESQLPN